jgi:hypothetical protein
MFNELTKALKDLAVAIAQNNLICQKCLRQRQEEFEFYKKLYEQKKGGE